MQMDVSELRKGRKVVIDGDPWDIVLELGFQRVTSTEEYDEGAVYVFAPSVGILL